MDVTMAKDVLKTPHFRINPTRIIPHVVVLFLLIGTGVLFYANIHKELLYEFPFSEEEIESIKFFSIMDNDEVLVGDKSGIKSLYDLLKKMCIDEQLPDTNETGDTGIPMGSQSFIITVSTKSGDVMVYQYDQLGRTSHDGYGVFSDGNNKYSVSNLDLTRIWLNLWEKQCNNSR